MTPEQVQLVQSSFARVAPISATAADLFYGRLFEIAPDVKPLFHIDIKEQGRKLMATLAFVVNGLREPATVLAAARQLAVRHVGYGVKAEHYGPVGEALLWTLAQGLGDDFTPDVAEAWKSAYGVLSGEMISAAYG